MILIHDFRTFSTRIDAEYGCKIGFFAARIFKPE